MSSTRPQEEPVSGAWALHDLPLHLMYKITRALDLKSQRNLFLCSSQLYSRWQLQVPDHDGWQFVDRSIKLLEAATFGTLCETTSHILLSVDTHISRTSGASQWAITCTNIQQSPRFSLSLKPCYGSGSSDQDTPDQVWFGMTKEQLWHRLTGAPDLVLANMVCDSHADLVPASDQMKLFARQTFDLLCTCHGLLTIAMNGLEDSPTEHGCHYLRIWHANHRPRSIAWEIDNETCIVDPPHIKFDDMPEEVTAIAARLNSHTTHIADNSAYFYPDSQVIHDFAYQGNVDIDAWIEMQHEAANDWYDHMDDFDDMEDLDDMEMANLVGAMQG
ncbi:hypothetical protein ABBQ38_007756 [Trebouxia sp. C0009 RCD-2024]